MTAPNLNGKVTAESILTDFMYGFTVSNSAAGAKTEAKRQLYTALLEQVIGEDEYDDTGTNPWGVGEKTKRNQLRAEQRQALKRFCGLDEAEGRAE